jgi:hypothetical protein
MTPPQEKRPSSGLAGTKLAFPERTINAGGKIEFQKLVRTISSSVSITKRRQQKTHIHGFFHFSNKENTRKIEILRAGEGGFTPTVRPAVGLNQSSKEQTGLL